MYTSYASENVYTHLDLNQRQSVAIVPVLSRCSHPHVRHDMSRIVSNSASSFACTHSHYINKLLKHSLSLSFWSHFPSLTAHPLCATVFALRLPAPVEAASAPKRRPSTWGAAAAADASSKGAGDANAAGATDLGARIAVDASQRRWYQVPRDFPPHPCFSFSVCNWTIRGTRGVCLPEKQRNSKFFCLKTRYSHAQSPIFHRCCKTTPSPSTARTPSACSGAPTRRCSNRPCCNNGICLETYWSSNIHTEHLSPSCQDLIRAAHSHVPLHSPLFFCTAVSDHTIAARAPPPRPPPVPGASAPARSSSSARSSSRARTPTTRAATSAWRPSSSGARSAPISRLRRSPPFRRFFF